MKNGMPIAEFKAARWNGRVTRRQKQCCLLESDDGPVFEASPLDRPADVLLRRSHRMRGPHSQSASGCLMDGRRYRAIVGGEEVQEVVLYVAVGAGDG